jgi:predicted small lipoprotein YifL
LAGIYALMQPMKTRLLLLTCSICLVACGLKGPLYLPDEDAGTQKGAQKESTSKETDPKQTDQKKDGLSS